MLKWILETLRMRYEKETAEVIHDAIVTGAKLGCLQAIETMTSEPATSEELRELAIDVESTPAKPKPKPKASTHAKPKTRSNKTTGKE